MVLSQPFMDMDIYSRLPKIELHRHLEGAVRLETLLEIEREMKICGLSEAELTARVQVKPTDALTVPNFLSKFDILRQFYRSKEIIQRLVYEAIEDAALENIRYMELRFAPAALSSQENFTLEGVIDWVIESAVKAAHSYGVKTRLISTLNRHESPEIAARIAALSAERISDGLVGVDLAGNEVEFSIQPFVPIFRRAVRDGLAISVHAAEWGAAENVRLAVEELYACRVGHGVRILEDEFVLHLARERGIVFEVCLTSNLLTGVTPRLQTHPLMAMLDAGLAVTLNSDDPAILNTDLNSEYRLAGETLGLSIETLTACIKNAAQAAFLPAEQRTLLVAELQLEIASLMDVAECISW